MNVIKKLINIIYGLALGAILVLCLFFSGISYSCKQTFVAPSIFIFLTALLVFIMAVYFYKKNQEKFTVVRVPIIALMVISFILQVFIYYNIYFKSGWDVRSVLDTAYLIVSNVDDTEGWEWSNFYYSTYPNNDFIVFLFSLLFRIYPPLLNNLENGLFFIIVIQCIICAFSGYLLYRVIEAITGSDLCALFGWIIYLLIIILAGWSAITYSDAWALIFPISMLWVYTKIEEANNKIPYYILLFALAYWGYRLKPTVMIVLIAIIITKLINYKKISRKMFVKVGIIFAVSMLIYQGAFSLMMKTTGLEIDPERNVGMTHMIKMGMNPIDHGVYNDDDVAMSFSIPTKSERDAANRAVIKDRLVSYGVMGFADHLARKMLCVYNDGTFAWGFIGTFYEEIYKPKIPIISNGLRSIYYNDGKLFVPISSMRHGIWLLTIFLGVFCIRYKDDNVLRASMLTVLGMIFFEMIFEASARQIYIFVPVFIVNASCGVKSLIKSQ